MLRVQQWSGMKEAMVTWRLIVSNIGATIIPGMLFSIAALQYYGIPFLSTDGLVGMGKSFIYFFLYIYTFDLTNQIAGVEEDRRNIQDVRHKEGRPIASGLISVSEAWCRWIFAMIIYAFLGYIWDVFIWTILWQISFFLHDICGGSKLWVSKDLTMSSGIIMQLAAAWELVGPMPSIVVTWIIFLAISNWWIVNIQDLRDVAGDIISNRKTLPIVIGVDKTRKLMAISFFLMAPITHVVCFRPLGNTWPVWLASAMTNAILWLVAARLCLNKYQNPYGDHRSYQIYIYWYCAILASAIIVM